MKNIPFFTTSAGVTGLVLEEIPYKKEAYIKIHTAVDPESLLQDAVTFCKAVGANAIYASGDALLEKYPLHTEILKLQCSKVMLQSTQATLCSVEENTAEQWRGVYNTNMRYVPNAATISKSSMVDLAKAGGCYFVYSGEVLIGIGKVNGSNVDAIVSLVQGMGKDVMLALCGMVTADRVTVEVANNNIPAMKLYQKLGFVELDKIAKWFRVY